MDPFHRLVSELSRILGPSSGLDSSEVDVAELQKLMEDYSSKEADWSQYALADYSRGYTRNLVDEGNGKSNLVRSPRGFIYTLARSSTNDYALAGVSLVARKGQSNSRSCRRTLPNESPQGLAEGDPLRFAQSRRRAAQGSKRDYI